MSETKHKNPTAQPAIVSSDAAPAVGRRGSNYSAGAMRVSVIVIATIASLWALQWGAPFLVPCTVAICMTFWLMPLVDRLQSWHVPRSLGAAFVLVALFGGLGFTGYMLRDDARGFAASLPKAAHHARVALNDAARDPNGILNHVRGVLSDRAPGGRVRSTAPEPVADPVDVQDVLVKGSTTFALGVANLVIAVFAIYLMLLSGDLFRRKLVAVIGNQVESGVLTRKRVTVEILNEISVQFQRYLGVLAITNIVIGLLTWAAFSALDVEHAAVWGVAAAVLHIIPYVGPAIIAAASFLVSALQFDSLSDALLVASTALCIFTLIGMLFSTWLAGRASNMNSVAVFTGLMFWGWLWGIAGLLLGTPLLMALKVVADRVDCLNWLGTFLGDAPRRERKTSAAESPPQVASEGLAASAATPVMSEPASIATEVTAEVAIELPDDVQAETEEEKHAPFEAPPFPA